MPPAPLLDNEQSRLKAVDALGLVGTCPTGVFEGFARVARTLFDAPAAAISLVEAHRQWLLAVDGLTGRETSREVSFCAHAILNPDEVLCVPDTLDDSRFAGNALVTDGPKIRFYAGAPITDEGGHAVGAICVIDFEPRPASQAQLDRLRDLAWGVSAAIQLHGMLRRAELEARSDPLTGLGNRREFDRVLGTMTDADATLFLLDLDHFKAINDLFGHAGGDSALREVARRLLQGGGPRRQAFRVEGDKFAVLEHRVRGRKQRLLMAERIHGSLSGEFLIEGQIVPLRTSIGIASLGEGVGASDLVRLADVALFEAKKLGRGMTRIAGDGRGLLKGPAMIGRIDLAERLREALSRGGSEPFRLAFQPVMHIETGEVSSLEALVRWEIAPEVRIPPSDFVPLAERMGLVSHLDRWVLREACAAAVRWPEPWVVSVNVSAVSFGLIDVVAMVREALAATRLAPARLMVEMTETALASDVALARRAVIGLRALGAGVALDDFGAGHGSLTTMRQFPFTELKLDRALIDGICVDRTHAHMVELVGQLGRGIGIPVVAEGVETARALRKVAELGATLAQGFLLSRPVWTEDVPGAVVTARQALREAFMVSPVP